MKDFELLAAFYSGYGLRQEADGLVIVACALLTVGFFLWRVTRYLKKDNAEELEREHERENVP